MIQREIATKTKAVYTSYHNWINNPSYASTWDTDSSNNMHLSPSSGISTIVGFVLTQVDGHISDTHEDRKLGVKTVSNWKLKINSFSSICDRRFRLTKQPKWDPLFHDMPVWHTPAYISRVPWGRCVLLSLLHDDRYNVYCVWCFFLKR